MNKLFVKKGIFALLYAVSAMLIEWISFAAMGLGAFPDYWGIDVAFIFAFSVLIFVIPSSVAAIVINGILLFLQVVVAFVNEALQGMSGMVFSLNMLNLTKEVAGVFTSAFVNWWLVAGLIALYAAEMSAMILLNVKMKTPKARLAKRAIIFLLVCCLVGENASLILYQVTINTFKSAAASDKLADYNDDALLYSTQFIPSKALKKFGFFGFYFMNISNTVGGLLKGNSAEIKDSELYSLDGYFAEGQMSDEVYGDTPYTAALAGKNIVLVVIESGEWYGINRDYTPTLYSMATEGIAMTNYYARDKTNHSEALSVLGSYPERSDPSTKLKNSKLSFTLPNLLRSAGYTTNYFHANERNFYNRNVTYGGGLYGFDNATFLEDMPFMDGSDGKDGFYDFGKDRQITEYYGDKYVYKKEDSRAFFTMQMTLSSHGHYEDLIDYGDYPFSDFEDLEYYDADMTQEEKLAKQESLQSHFSKKCSVKGFEKYYEIIDGYPEYPIAGRGIKFSPDFEEMSEEEQKKIYLRYKRFQAGMMDLDEEMNTLVGQLRQSGELDNTAFFFYADHTAYYNSQNYYLKGVPIGDIWNTALYNIPCFMWYGGSMNLDTSETVKEFYDGYNKISFTATKDTKSALRQGRIEKFVNTFDVLPTLLQLAGYNYNLNLYQGVSMLEENAGSVFVSRESGMFTDKIFYDGITVSEKQEDGTWKSYDFESEYDEISASTEIISFLEQTVEYRRKQQILERMYETDYFAYRPILSPVAYKDRIIRYVKQADGLSSL